MPWLCLHEQIFPRVSRSFFCLTFIFKFQSHKNGKSAKGWMKINTWKLIFDCESFAFPMHIFAYNDYIKLYERVWLCNRQLKHCTVGAKWTRRSSIIILDSYVSMSGKVAAKLKLKYSCWYLANRYVCSLMEWDLLELLGNFKRAERFLCNFWRRSSRRDSVEQQQSSH